MADKAIADELHKLETSSDTQEVKSAAYQQLLDQIVAQSIPDNLATNLTAFLDFVLGESLGIVAARPLLSVYVDAIRSLGDPLVKIDCGKRALQSLEPRVASFEDQDVSIRQILADVFQEQEDFIEAAKVLQGMQLETSQRRFSDEEKVKIWIRICRLYFEEDDTTSAESYLNRAKNLLYKIHDPELNLTFQLCQARILDSRQRFLEASEAYHKVSMSSAMAEEERNFCLSKAIICAVLAPAGPQRSRLLGKLYKDERAAQLEEFGILEKMFLDRLISPIEVEKFAEKLSSHQLAPTADGSTVLAKAVVEHNLFGASKLYSNLAVAELGLLLGLDAEKAEHYAARMLEQKRIAGSIDQIQGLVFFEGQDATGDKAAGGFSPTRQSLRTWDRHVQGLVEDVERVSSLLQAEVPVGLPLLSSTLS
ncbi:COP9 signalosome complex subunit 4 [Thelotrema lepadinum]|nr:COP9 signalosome complex subunit 4 [Thelotrema lepadinum]